MIKLSHKLSAGVALASILVSTVPASAQMVPQPQGAPAPTATPAPSPAPQTANRFIAVTRSDLTGGYRSPQAGDNDMAVLSLDQFVAAAARRGIARPEATAMFDQIGSDNREGCSETGAWVREAISIANDAMIIDDQLVGFYRQLDDLGRAQNGASNRAIGGQVVSTVLLCGLSFGLYCGAAVAGGIGNVGNISANKRANRVDRQMRLVNTDQSRVQIRATLLNMRATIGWAQRFQRWCMIVFPNDTVGNGGGTNVTPNWGYPNGSVALYSAGPSGRQPTPGSNGSNGGPPPAPPARNQRGTDDVIPQGFWQRNK